MLDAVHNVTGADFNYYREDDAFRTSCSSTQSENMHATDPTLSGMALGAVGATVADRYRLEKFLGRGGYGEVWRAHDTYRNHTIALKLLLNRDRRQAWYEASLLTALSSPHILAVNNADVAVDVPYLDTALAKCSLDAISQPIGVEPRLAIDWTRRALRGLDLCHRRGLLHRDVKPDNIFLTMEGDARLGDFGIAALMDAAGSAAPDGDPRIWAPEFYQGTRATVASDIYAAAVTLYALLAGRMPFNQTHQADLDAAIQTGDCPDIRDIAPHVSRALADKVRQGMALLPLERFTLASLFDSKLGGLPSRPRHIEPISAHQGHDRCWHIAGKGAAIYVCLTLLQGSAQANIETRRVNSGTRVTEHCAQIKATDIPIRLRRLFGALIR
ncbi:serine/threonine-protein kinase [Kribbella rubisoli]|uniref:Serine/threonine-protein kinase n=1 Tax=Kribbella rubisoli TaxID=3075929 RepID=A0A4Q7WV98_9ACTN|nr:serine/threonine-protein kinase [Kribbella rubisoli]RZU13978.1 serine/threonine-protein kinase [Kribbella rubisoli]